MTNKPFLKTKRSPKKSDQKILVLQLIRELQDANYWRERWAKEAIDRGNQSNHLFQELKKADTEINKLRKNYGLGRYIVNYEEKK